MLFDFWISASIEMAIGCPDKVRRLCASCSSIRELAIEPSNLLSFCHLWWRRIFESHTFLGFYTTSFIGFSNSISFMTISIALSGLYISLCFYIDACSADFAYTIDRLRTSTEAKYREYIERRQFGNQAILIDCIHLHRSILKYLH